MEKIQAFERNYLSSKKEREAIKLAERKKHLKKENKMKSFSIKKEREQIIEFAKKLGLEKIVDYDKFIVEHKLPNETQLDCLKREYTKQNINPVFNTIFQNMGMIK